MRIYLSPSNQNGNKCKHGDTERDHCNAIVDALIPYLDANGIEWKRAGLTETMASRCKASDAFKADFHYCIHTNAGGGSRSVIYGYDTANAKWKKAADAIRSRRATIYPREIRLAKNRTFYEINTPKATTIYDEVAFHDNAADVAFIHGDTDAIAREIAHGLCLYAGKPFIDPNTTAQPQVEDYMSQIAAIVDRWRGNA